MKELNLLMISLVIWRMLVPFQKLLPYEKLFEEDNHDYKGYIASYCLQLANGLTKPINWIIRAFLRGPNSSNIMGWTKKELDDYRVTNYKGKPSAIIVMLICLLFYYMAANFIISLLERSGRFEIYLVVVFVLFHFIFVFGAIAREKILASLVVLSLLAMLASGVLMLMVATAIYVFSEEGALFITPGVLDFGIWAGGIVTIIANLVFLFIYLKDHYRGEVKPD